MEQQSHLMSTKNKKGFHGQGSLESVARYSSFLEVLDVYWSFNSLENFSISKLFCLTRYFQNLFDYGIICHKAIS